MRPALSTVLELSHVSAMVGTATIYGDDHRRRQEREARLALRQQPETPNKTQDRLVDEVDAVPETTDRMKNRSTKRSVPTISWCRLPAKGRVCVRLNG